MKTVSIGEIVELNHRLMKQDIPYKIHLKDACAGQSFTIEALNGNFDTENKQLYQTLEDYFNNIHMSLFFGEDKKSFVIK